MKITKGTIIGTVALTIAALAAAYTINTGNMNKKNTDYTIQRAQDICQNSQEGWEHIPGITQKLINDNTNLMPVLPYQGNGIFNYTTKDAYLQTLRLSASHLANSESIRPVLRSDMHTGRVEIDCGAPYVRDTIDVLVKTK